MILCQYPCPKCNSPVEAYSDHLMICPPCGHQWWPRPSTLDHIWFGHQPYVNPLAIYLAMEKWCSRGWAEAAAANDVDNAMYWSEALIDIIALRRSGKPGRHVYESTKQAIR
jgi:hypothetical protein